MNNSDTSLALTSVEMWKRNESVATDLIWFDVVEFVYSGNLNRPYHPYDKDFSESHMAKDINLESKSKLKKEFAFMIIHVNDGGLMFYPHLETFFFFNICQKK